MSAAHVLVLGPHGVTGSAITTHLASDRWVLTTASRRPAGGSPGRHLRVDLCDAAATRTAFAGLGGITHVVYAAYLERPTMAETVAPNLAMLVNTLDGLQAAGAHLDRVVLIGGGKSYGEHLGPYKTPAKESDPRHLGPIFYNDQEDHLIGRAATTGLAWTVLRPDVVIGPSTGSPMNLLTSIAVYAALCQDAGVPLRFPGSPEAWTALHQVTDAQVLAAAVEWALLTPAAAGEIYNVTNGDLFRWQHLWAEIAGVFDLPVAPPQPMSLVEQLSDKAPVWDALVTTHRLRPIPYDRLTSWAFTDAVWNTGYDMVQDTTKIARAGFHVRADSHQSITTHLQRLRTQKYVP